VTGREGRPATSQRGMVTAELAVAILAAAALLAMLSWGIFLITIQLRCIDVAAAVARQTARGDSAAALAAERGAPPGASVQVRKTATLVTVSVRVRVPAFRWTTGGPGAGEDPRGGRDLGAGLGSVELQASSEVVPEQGS
jgi:hypothetical protein